MGKIYSAQDAQQRRLDRFDRDRLELFSDTPAVEFTLPPPLQPQEVSGQTVDHGELRETLMAELRAEAQEQVEAAFREGHRRGHEAGRQEFLTSTAQAAAALEAAAAAMTQAREAFLSALEPQVLELVTLLCRKVLARELTTDIELVQRTVRRALEQIADQQKLLLRLNPEDLEAIRAHRVTLLEEFPAIEELELQPDPAVTAGGCIAESRTLQVDARLEVLLENVLEALRG